MSLEPQLRRFAGWAGLLVGALGLLVIAGVLLGGSALPAGLDLRQLKATTGIAFLLVGGALWLHVHGFRRAAQVCAAIVPAVSLLRVTEAVAGGNFGLDRWLERSTTPRERTASGGLSHGAVGFALCATALLSLGQQRHRQRFPVSAWLANFMIAGAAAGLLARALASGEDFQRPIRLGSHVAVALLVMGVGLLFARPDDKHVAMLFARNAAGILARRLFVGAAILPVAFGSLLVLLLREDVVGATDGVALLVATLILCGFSLALFSLETAANISDGREEAEQARILLTARLQEQAAQLQETVNLRTRELREANASLRAAADSNALLALVAQNTSSGVVIADAEGRVEWVNQAFERATGYALEELRGHKPGHVLQGANTDPATVAQLREAVRAGRPCSVEILNYTKAKQPLWFAMNIQPVRDSSGRLINFVSNQTDVTEARAAQSRLQHLNQRFELATRAAALGIWEWDALTLRSVWDERTLEIYGLRPDQFRGLREDWVDRLHPAEREHILAEVQAAFERDGSYEHTFRIVRARDGVVRHVQSRAILQRDAQGRVLRVIGTERDITPEREATERMEALNDRLHLALRSSNYGVWENDLAAGRRVWDERMLEIYGLRGEDFDGSEAAWLRTFHPDDREGARAHVRSAIAGGVSDYDLQFRIVRPDGAIRHLEAHGHVERDANGKAIRLVGLSRDITEQKRLEQALELAEQRWQLAIEGTDDSVWDWDIETGYVYHDERWSRMLGYAPAELAHTNDAWLALVHPDDLAPNLAATRAHFEQRTPFYQHELRMRAKDGSWRWILDRGKVVRRAADDRPLRMAGTHTDITARKELEERLRKTEELANEVSRLAQIGGWEIDLESSRVTWTEGTRRIHEVDDSFVPSFDTIWQFFPSDALATVQGALADASPSSPSFDVEVPLLTARGRRVWVRMLGHGEFHGTRAISVHGAIQDVTARHEGEEARRELEGQLFQAQKMETLGTLAGGIAHDFNNLLTGIIGYHELAADSVPEDHPARACLTEARHASLRARELVEQILTFGRQSGGIEHAPIDLSLVIEEARRFLRATLPANITIEVHLAPHCPSVLADATQIHQVILNLGSNSAHAMRHNGGVLKVSLEQIEVTPDLALTLGGPPASSYLRLSVSDNGHGMDESTRRRIFDPFFTTKNTREGTGLGLAVVHGIVRAHRGAIDVESSPGQGSTFHVYLPTALDEFQSESGSSSSSPRGQGEYVCVVDDEEVVGSCTKLVLESKGYRALIFGSAEQCLAELEHTPNACAVLVTDQTMPGMQGTELAAAMRRTQPDLPVVIMSGYFSKISPQALDELGQVELLAKPFTTDELALAVHRALHPPERAMS